MLLASLARAETSLTIEAVGVETAAPEVFHIMMKMESESGLAADATVAGEKRLKEFLAAIDGLAISGLTARVHNTVLTPVSGGYRPGLAYGRNIVFTIPEPGSVEERNRIIARIQDLGAKFNSHCVTCIGSG
ncbi:MAG TPA: hypothetical protein VFL57_02535 [Bryobacteraceae bacterium]|nr:hypothetical protein [Bryobacteraceae bacterium]